MGLLIAWMIILSLISLMNGLFTFGLIRRLREHARLLASSTNRRDEQVMLARGETAGDFTATTLDGRPVTRSSFTAPTLVAFFSPHCGACTEQLPGFLALATTMPARRAQVLAVVVGPQDETAHLRDQLGEVATVVLETNRDSTESGPVSAFGVRGFPAFAIVDADGVVVDSGYDLAQLAVPVSS